MDREALEKLNEYVAKKANERYILSKVKTLRNEKIGEDNLYNLIKCLRWKDVNYNNQVKIKMSDVSMDIYDNQPYETYMQYFNRSIKNDVFNEIQKESLKHQIIVPNECNVESIGIINDPTSIVRLKKDAKSVVEDLNNLGVPLNYTFVNMKLFVSYYHNVHSPVSGKLVKIVEVDRNLGLFGKNTLWLLEFETDKKPVYFMLVGESTIQDFKFEVKVGDNITIADRLGMFMWGSQTILLFDKESYNGDILIGKKNHYFLGKPIIS